MYIRKYSKIFLKLIISNTAFPCSSWLYGLTWLGQWGNEEKSNTQVQVQKSWNGVATAIALLQALLLRYSYTELLHTNEKETELANLGRKSSVRGVQAIDIQRYRAHFLHSWSIFTPKARKSFAIPLSLHWDLKISVHGWLSSTFKDTFLMTGHLETKAFRPEHLVNSLNPNYSRNTWNSLLIRKGEWLWWWKIWRMEKLKEESWECIWLKYIVYVYESLKLSKNK